MKYLLLFLISFCFSCARNIEQVDKIVIDFHIECLKSESHLGVGFGGKDTSIISTNQCIASQCYKRSSKLGRRYGDYDVLTDIAVEMKECVEWKQQGNTL